MSAKGTCYEDANGTEILEGDLLAEYEALFDETPKYRVIWQRGYEAWYAETLDEEEPYIIPLYMVADDCVVIGRID